MMGFYQFVSTVFVSIITSLLVWRFYINWQYNQSTAGHRLKNIIEAMLLIFRENRTGEPVKDEIYLRYKSSLGIPLYKMYLVFGFEEERKISRYPLFCLQSPEDTADFFKTAVWPAMVDINNNSFIGWLPGVPNVERLLTIQEICFQIEKVAGWYEAIRSIEKKESVLLVEQVDNNAYKLNESAAHQNYLDALISETEKLYKYWQRWIALIRKHENYQKRKHKHRGDSKASMRNNA